MNKLLLVLAGLALAGNAYSADDTQVKFNGEIRARYWNSQNENAGKNTQPTQNSSAEYQRTKLGVTATKGENLTGHVDLLQAGAWGRDVVGATGTAETTNISAANSKNVVMIDESYIWWKASDMMSLKVGRGGMTVADGSVLSNNDWDQVPRVFDGALGVFDFGFANLGVFGVKAIEYGKSSTTLSGTSGSTPAYDKESVFYGLTFDFKNLPDAIKMANILILQESQDIVTGTGTGNPPTAPVPSTSNRNYLRYSLTVGGDVSNIDFKGTYAGISGKNRAADSTSNDIKVNAGMFDLAAGYTLPEMMSMRFGAVYHSDTGDDDGTSTTATDASNYKNNTYEPFQYDQHEYSGKMDIVGWGNITYVGGNFAITPMDKTTFGLEYLAFSRTTNKSAANITGGQGTIAAPGANDKIPVGQEIDITATHKYSDAFGVEFRVGSFTPGDYLLYDATGAQTARDNVTDIYLNAAYKF